jgi:hypothetical protein
MRSLRTATAYAATLALTVAFVACGGSGTGPTQQCPAGTTGTFPNCATIPTPAPPVVVSQGGGTLEVDFLARVPFTTTQAGSLDITVDWTYAANDLDVFLVRNDCSFDDFFDEVCLPIALSISTTAKPERVHFGGAAAGVYTLFVGNVGPGDESASYQVVLSPGAAASNRRPGEPLPEKARRYRQGRHFP